MNNTINLERNALAARATTTGQNEESVFEPGSGDNVYTHDGSEVLQSLHANQWRTDLPDHDSIAFAGASLDIVSSELDDFRAGSFGPPQETKSLKPELVHFISYGKEGGTAAVSTQEELAKLIPSIGTLMNDGNGSFNAKAINDLLYHAKAATNAAGTNDKRLMILLRAAFIDYLDQKGLRQPELAQFAISPSQEDDPETAQVNSIKTLLSIYSPEKSIEDLVDQLAQFNAKDFINGIYRDTSISYALLYNASLGTVPEIQKLVNFLANFARLAEYYQENCSPAETQEPVVYA